MKEERKRAENKTKTENKKKAYELYVVEGLSKEEVVEALTDSEHSICLSTLTRYIRESKGRWDTQRAVAMCSEKRIQHLHKVNLFLQLEDLVQARGSYRQMKKLLPWNERRP